MTPTLIGSCPDGRRVMTLGQSCQIPTPHCSVYVYFMYIQGYMYDLINQSGAPDGSVLQNIYSADIVSWLAKAAEQILNLYKCINLYILKYLSKNILLFS